MQKLQFSFLLTKSNSFPLCFQDEELLGDEQLTPEAVVWPAVILRGNGDVCLLNTSLASNEKPKFEGPLTMYPPADDNYGVDACSILVLPTLPNTIIVATSSGTLYHSVLLKFTEEEVRWKVIAVKRP